MFRLRELSEEMRAAGAAYAPESGPQIGRDMAQMPDVLVNVAQSVGNLARLAEGELPVHRAVVDLLHGISAQILLAAQSSADLGPLFALMHQTDWDRLRALRPGEDLWDSKHAGDA